MTHTAPLRILSWNIQSGKDCDGRINLRRIADYIRDRETPHILCLQEVARHFDCYTTPDMPDQLAFLCAAFPDHTPVWGASLSWPHSGPLRREFGNLTLVSTPLLDSRVHSLPATGTERTPGAKQTPRCAVETIVTWGAAPLRIFNTHLAYHCEHERAAQLRHLCALQEQAEWLTDSPPAEGHGIFSQQAHTARTVLCGDLNLDSRSEQYCWLLHQGWQDAWTSTLPAPESATTDHNPPAARPPTCGVFDADQWPQGPHCRDYFLLRNLVPSGIVSMTVDTFTDYSDHQPILLTLGTAPHDNA
ncbi:endonuclease/exonuclease/phosphatase family protein [Desulfovibrio psychrotolerans]|uniref:Endonuclease n=1 Tax=Desulfovibrio psychrotolerans TaxID=415242 RepID=A0A7J0BSP7_9BACT|nr:endonuclease/exonuclease/phosphatase family protein [Desulfovibrio psychrotolerans]GFM36192.1 endonuclease [Desulfovibrio psychrotolerans]